MNEKNIKKKLIIIDGNNVAYRAFFALPMLANKKGQFTNAIFGFINMLIKLIEEKEPTHLVVVFDFPSRDNFRSQMYEQYKATRKPMPEELKNQMTILKDLLKKMGISVFEKQGFEADDVIGTLSKKFCKTDCEVTIATGDRDCLQLVDENISVLLSKKGLSNTQLVDNKNFKELYGFLPPSIVDLKAIMGDASDNIPGVNGIGEKGATELIKKYTTLEEIYKNLDELPPKQREALTAQKDIAVLSKRLAKIDCDVKKLGDCFDEFEFCLPIDEKVKEDFLELEFFSLLKKPKLFGEPMQIKKEDTIDTKLFDLSVTAITEPSELQAFVDQFSDDSMSIMLFDGDIYVQDKKIEVAKNLLSSGIAVSEVAKILKPILTNDKIKKIVFDYKQLAHFFLQFGIVIAGDFDDIQVAIWLVDSGQRNSDIKNFFESNNVDTPSANVLRIFITQALAKMAELSLLLLYKNIELPCLKVLFEMEKTGIKIDKGMLSELVGTYQKELLEVEKKIFASAGGILFNINSPKQVCEVIYDKLRIIKTTGKKSSDIGILQKYADKHPIINMLIEYRQLQKLISTYILPLKEYADNDSLVRTTFNLTGTTTGRLSSSNPNLQNIPNKSEKGKAIRKAFISRFDGGKLVCADYNQIELRLLAHFSGDEVLISAYSNDEDIHRRTASEIFGIPLDSVTDEARSSAKAVNFGIIYGMSSFGLSEYIDSTPFVAKQYIDLYFERFSRIKKYLEQSVEDAKNNDGKTSTLFGRVRFIKELFSSNFNTREFGRRAAQNFPLQGSAADIIKIAMIEIDKKLREQKLEARLVLQIHDELVVDTPPNEVEKVEELLKTTMQNITTIAVPLKVGIESNYRL